MSGSAPRVAGIIYHALLSHAEELADALKARYSPGGEWWSANQATLAQYQDRCDESELLVTIGGDGTILRGVHEAAPRGIPVVGVNLGRVGFMSEIDATDAVEGLGWYLEGNARVERRAMLRVQILQGDGNATDGPHDALNDVVVGRGAILRLIEVETVLDGTRLATYRGDGVVVATATGSTGYCLSLGGPVMDPESDSILLKPIAAHMSLHGGAMLPANCTLDLTLRYQNPATLSVDGFIDRMLSHGQVVRVRQSPHRALFLRRHSTDAFWGSVTRRLGMRQGALPRQAREQEDLDTIEDRIQSAEDSRYAPHL